MTTASSRRPGFTLIEMLCVFALLAVMALVLALLFREMVEMERAQADGFDQMLQDNVLIDQFRADAANAEKSLVAWELFKADAETLILLMKNGDHIVYHWQPGAMQRQRFEAKDTIERTLPVHGRSVGVEFVHEGSAAKMVRLLLHRERDGAPLPGQTLEIAAALGGDWR